MNLHRNHISFPASCIPILSNMVVGSCFSHVLANTSSSQLPSFHDSFTSERYQELQHESWYGSDLIFREVWAIGNSVEDEASILVTLYTTCQSCRLLKQMGM